MSDTCERRPTNKLGQAYQDSFTETHLKCTMMECTMVPTSFHQMVIDPSAIVIMRPLAWARCPLHSWIRICIGTWWGTLFLKTQNGIWTSWRRNFQEILTSIVEWCLKSIGWSTWNERFFILFDGGIHLAINDPPWRRLLTRSRTVPLEKR